MNRRRGVGLRIALVGLLVSVLTGCGSEPREAAAPPPIAAKPAAPDPPQAAAPAPTSAPVPAPTAPPTLAPPSRTPVPSTPAPTAEPVPAPAQLPDPNAVPKDEKPADPLKWMQDRQARRFDYERQLQAAKDEAERAASDAANWDRIVLQFKNPFLPRPQLSPEDAATIQPMSNPDRVKWAQGKASEARARQSAAQEKIDTLQANPPPY